jgi:signal transduction histidine kinase
MIPYRAGVRAGGTIRSVRFDDTLDTVLAADVSTPFGKASTWRQLVDLIGRRRVPAERRALMLLESIRPAVPLAVRAASARALELASPPYVLVRLCAVDDISVAAPVLRSARLNSGEWIELLPRLSAAGRTVVRARRDLPPGVEGALKTFTVDFVIEGDVAEPVADDAGAIAEAVDVAPVAEVAETEPTELLIDWTQVIAARPAPAASPLERAPGATDEVVESAPPVAEPQIIDWTEVIAARPAEPRPRIRIRPDITREAPEQIGDASSDVVDDALSEPDDAPPPVAIATPSTFVSVGAAALAIPAVAAALQQVGQQAGQQAVGDGDEVAESALTQSETAPTPEPSATLAPESVVAHDSPMSGEETILVDREGAAAIVGLRPEMAEMPDGEVATGDIATDPVAGGEAVGEATEGPFEIAEVVARIDAFYTRQQDRREAPVEPARGGSFRFETDEQGVIRWVEGVARAPLIGLSLDMTAMADGSRVDGVAAGAFRRRAAFGDARLIVAGESDAAGDWRISATPAFDPATGRFSGYRGMGRRPRADESPVVRAEGDGTADSLRQLMHELRTPTNAIAGFAEMIEREMLGDAPPVYRDRAATIRTHARALLAAIDDLDIAARIEGSALRLQAGEVALRPLLARIADDLGALSAMRGAWIALPIDNLVVSGDLRGAERLFSRLLATLVSAAGQDERVEVRLAAESDDQIAVTLDLPLALRRHAGEALFGIDDEQEAPALLGTGFALRLVRNLAREMAGSLVIEAESLTVRLPAAVTKSLEVVR